MAEETSCQEPDQRAASSQEGDLASEVARLRRLLAVRENQLAFLFQVGRDLGATLDIDSVMSRTVEVARATLQAESGSLILLDESGEVSGVIAAVRDRPAEVTHYVVRRVLEQGLASWVVQHRCSAIVEDTRTDSRWIELQESVHNIRSAICVPLIYLDRLCGLLTLTDPRPGHFVRAHLMLLNAVAPQIAIALENASLYRSMDQSRARLQAILANMSDALVVVNAQGEVTLVNAALEQLVGRPAAEFVGRSYQEAIRLEGESCSDPIAGILSGTSPGCEIDLLLYDGGGKVIPVRLGCGPLPGPADRPSGVVIALRDIRYLKEVERMRDDLIDMLVHDLKAPLASIASTIQLLRQGSPSATVEDTISELLSIAEKNTWRLTRMVEAMLDVQRLESGRFPLHPDLLDAVVLVREVVDQAAPLASEDEIELRVALDPDLPPVEADADMLRRVLWNLLDNALKYSTGGGLIQVKGRRVQASGGEAPSEFTRHLPVGEWVVLTVIDSGPGIPPDDQERIFDKFAQARISRERRRGVGLGLAFCRLAVEAHGGHIWVDSRLGSGSTFHFALPAASAQ